MFQKMITDPLTGHIIQFVKDKYSKLKQLDN